MSQIKRFSVSRLRQHPANAHALSKKQIAQIWQSIRQFGFTVAIIVDENNVILAGHGRWLATQHLGLELVPVAILFGRSDAERCAYLLAGNKLVENASSDRAALALELKELPAMLGDPGLDSRLTGFEPAEDALIGDLIDPEVDPAQELRDIDKRPISRKGDLWLLARHRLRTPYHE
jgi:ParB-like chromosome segregation protein Spo0J